MDAVEEASTRFGVTTPRLVFDLRFDLEQDAVEDGGRALPTQPVDLVGRALRPPAELRGYLISHLG
eukprot:5804132-Amphidinium_carterae.2